MTINSNAIFWLGIIILIFANSSFYVFWRKNKVDSIVVIFFLLLELIGISSLIAAWSITKYNEKYIDDPSKDYNSAYLTGNTPGGAVYVDNLDETPGLGWII